MKKAFVFSEGPDGNGLIRKTVVLKETEFDLGTQTEIETISTFVIITDIEGFLHEAYELDLEAEIQEEAFTNEHTIPISVPDNNIIQLDIDNPENSQ